LPKKIILFSGRQRVVLSRWLGGIYSNANPRSISQMRSFYNAIAPIYKFHVEPERKFQLAAFLPFLPPEGRVLDASAGDCTFAKVAGKKFDVWCSDISEKMLALRPKTFSKNKVFVASASRLPFKPSSFDAIVHTFSNIHCLDRKFFAEFFRLLAPGGILLYHPVKGAGEQWPKNFVSKTFFALRSSGFSQISRKSAESLGRKKSTLIFYLARKQ